MSTDRYDKWFGRLVRLIMLVLGTGGFAFEVLSPSRTLWVGILTVGLLMGQIATVVEALTGGYVRIGRDREGEERR